MIRQSFVAGALAFLLLAAVPAAGQLGERPGLSDDTSNGPMDFSGLSVKTPRTRVVHTTDPSLAGGSMYLQTFDPFLAYKMGKDLTQREMRPRDGVFSADIANFKGKLLDGMTPAIVGNDHVSCGACHNIPYRDAGGGTNFAKQAGTGRNSPHFFGSGILEMLAWQVRQKMMQQIDTNRNNWVDASEMNGQRILVEPAPGARGIDYGASGDGDGDGWPDLDNIFRVWFVDAAGHYVDAKSLSDEGVAGYNFILEVFGWGEERFNLNTTNRVFVWDPFVSHGGLEAHDPTIAYDPDGDGWSQVSNAGFQQTWVGHIPPDPGKTLNSVGLSLDDPDGDGVINEISEGDLDVAEWYLLNSPRPGTGRRTPETERGRELFADWRCDRCHVQTWKIEAADPDNPDIHKRYLGDLRFFDFEVTYNDEAGRLEGRLVPLYDIGPDGAYVRRKGSFMVRGMGSDLRDHKMGSDLAEVRYDGSVVNAFRTAPLWGNGATGMPWSHDGRSMSLDEAIRRHDAEGRASRNRYVQAPPKDREAVLAWLRTHTLYPTELVPADIDGDGEIAERFTVAGVNTGEERFNAEWLFETPGRIEGIRIGGEGLPRRSFALTNLSEAYGLELPYLVDSDLDGFADVQDECPSSTGYSDGCR